MVAVLTIRISDIERIIEDSLRSVCRRKKHDDVIRCTDLDKTPAPAIPVQIAESLHGSLARRDFYRIMVPRREDGRGRSA